MATGFWTETRERLRRDVFLHFNLVQVGVTVGGCLVIYMFMLEACPGLMGMAWELFIRAAPVGLALGAFSLLYNLSYLRALFALRRFTFSGREMEERTWETLRDAASRLPLRLLLLTFFIWPPGIIAIAVWMKLAGILNLEDSVRIAVCGALYSPLQGLILFYSSRYSMRRLATLLHESGHGMASERRGGLGIREKLIASFVCLAVVPLLAGALISEVQRERAAVKINLNEACRVLDQLQAAAGPANDWDKAAQAVAGKLAPDTEFLVAGEGGNLVMGRLDRPARKVWRQGIASNGAGSECLRLPVPAQRRFVVMKFYKGQDPPVWIGAVTSPFAPSAPFWSSYGVTLVLLGAVVALGVILGFIAAADVGNPLKDLSASAVKASQGELVVVSGFLPDDEMSELAFGFNTLIASIIKELKRSSALVSEVRGVISGLSEQTAAITDLGHRQGEVIEEQNSLAIQASGGAEEVTRAAGEIKDRAHSTQYQMEEVAVASQEADTTLKEVSKIIADMVEHSELIWHKMEALESNYRRMEEVVGIIDDIAERTEILALNAALEAGTGRGSGERLSVVAGEVQHLSERISEQTMDIRRLFNEIRRSSMEMAQTIDVGRSRAREGPPWIKRLEDSLKGIENRGHAASSSMAEIVNMTGEQGQALEQMKILISEIQAVASVIDEVNSGAEATVKRLNKLAELLGKLVREKE